MEIISKILKDLTSTIGDRGELDDLMSVPLIVQAIFGQQILNPKWSWNRHIFEHVFIVCLSIYVSFGTADVFTKATDVASKGEAGYTFLILLLFLTEYIFFVENRKGFMQVYLTTKTTILPMIKIISYEQSILLTNKLKLIVKILLVIVFVPVIIYLTAVIWLNNHGERITLSKTTSILIPMTSPYYEIGLLLHLIFLIHMAFSICVIEIWFLIMTVIYCVASDCLKILLQAEPRTENESALAYGNRLNDTLRIFYKYHVNLMEYFGSVTNAYKWPLMIPQIGAVLKVCFIMFLISEKIQWSFLSNIVPVLFLLFSQNWAGEQVKTKAADLETAYLHFDWLSLHQTDRKKYLLIIVYIMKKDISFKSAFGKDMSLSTLADILKAGYQVYTLLNSMKE